MTTIADIKSEMLSIEAELISDHEILFNTISTNKKAYKMFLHGIDVFGGEIKSIIEWLISPSYKFRCKPIHMLTTDEGIEAIDNMLTNIEWGNLA